MTLPLLFPKLGYNGLGQYVLLEDFLHEGNSENFIVPQGFVTDLASVPRVFWSLLPPQGGYEAAAVLHDYLCIQLARARRLNQTAPVSSTDTDGLFRHIMRSWGVGPVTRWVMWTGVRWGALFNPARRAGWWKGWQPWQVLGISVAGLVLALAGALAIHFGVDVVLGWLS